MALTKHNLETNHILNSLIYFRSTSKLQLRSHCIFTPAVLTGLNVLVNLSYSVSRVSFRIYRNIPFAFSLDSNDGLFPRTSPFSWNFQNCPFIGHFNPNWIIFWSSESRLQPTQQNKNNSNCKNYTHRILLHFESRNGYITPFLMILSLKYG